MAKLLLGFCSTLVQLLKSTDLGRHSLLYLKEIGHGWFGKVSMRQGGGNGKVWACYSWGSPGEGALSNTPQDWTMHPIPFSSLWTPDSEKSGGLAGGLGLSVLARVLGGELYHHRRRWELNGFSYGD